MWQRRPGNRCTGCEPFAAARLARLLLRCAAAAGHPRHTVAYGPLTYLLTWKHATAAAPAAQGFRQLAAQEHQLAVPIYACHGSNDVTTNLPAVRRLLASARGQDKTLKVIEGGCAVLCWAAPPGVGDALGLCSGACAPGPPPAQLLARLTEPAAIASLCCCLRPRLRLLLQAPSTSC